MEALPLIDRVALVTGGSRGLGKVIAEKLATLGADIALISRSPAHATQKKIQAVGRRSTWEAADVTSPDQIRRALNAAVATLGRLDYLVAAAGSGKTGLTADVTEQLWDEVINTNLKGAFFSCQAAYPYLEEHQGAAVLISSIFGQVGGPGLSTYCASKGGLEQLAKALAVEWGASGVRINCVAPGYVRTEMNKQALANPSFRKLVLSLTPLERLCTSEEIASAVAYLLSDDAKFVTGHRLAIDGGWTAR